MTYDQEEASMGLRWTTLSSLGFYDPLSIPAEIPAMAGRGREGVDRGCYGGYREESYRQMYSDGLFVYVIHYS